MKDIFIVSCTRGHKEETGLYRSLTKLGINKFHFFENNRVSLPTCYNRIIDEHAGQAEIMLFVHDDVVIGDVFIREKLNETADRKGYVIMGLAGAATFELDLSAARTGWHQRTSKGLSGAVEHVQADGTNIMLVWGPTPQRCVVMDGLFLAVDVGQIGRVRFDERFQFHFYDLDFCLTAHRAGLPLGTTNVYVTHQSFGDFGSPMFFSEQEKFRLKWKDNT